MIVTCRRCFRERRHTARGLCRACYVYQRECGALIAYKLRGHVLQPDSIAAAARALDVSRPWALTLVRQGRLEYVNGVWAMKSATKKRKEKAIQAYVNARTIEDEAAAYAVARAWGVTIEELEAAKQRKERR